VLANIVGIFFPFSRSTHHYRTNKCPLVDALGGRHGSLDGQASNVLPALLEKRDEVVDGQHDVTDQLILSHLDVTDGDTHAENLLQLELDGRLDLSDLVGEIFGVRDGGGELAGLGETGTQETRNLLDESLGSDEGIVLASELLDQLLVLVELSQVLSGHGINTEVLGTIDIVLVTENADGHVGAGDLGELDGTRETLVTLRVVVLETDLELDGLEEVALLLIEGVVEELLHVGAHSGDSDLRHDAGCLPRE